MGHPIVRVKIEPGYSDVLEESDGRKKTLLMTRHSFALAVGETIHLWFPPLGKHELEERRRTWMREVALSTATRNRNFKAAEIPISIADYDGFITPNHAIRHTGHGMEVLVPVHNFAAAAMNHLFSTKELSLGSLDPATQKHIQKAWCGVIGVRQPA